MLLSVSVVYSAESPQIPSIKTPGGYCWWTRSSYLQVNTVTLVAVYTTDWIIPTGDLYHNQIYIYIYIYILISYLHIHILPWNTIYKGHVFTAILLDSALHQAKNHRAFGSLIQGTWDSRSQEPATVARWTHRVTTGSMPCCRCSCWCRGSSCKNGRGVNHDYYEI